MSVWTRGLWPPNARIAVWNAHVRRSKVREGRSVKTLIGVIRKIYGHDLPVIVCILFGVAQHCSSPRQRLEILVKSMLMTCL